MLLLLLVNLDLAASGAGLPPVPASRRWTPHARGVIWTLDGRPVIWAPHARPTVWPIREE